MPELELEYNARADMDEYANVMQQIHDTVPDPHEEQRRRNEIWDPLIELVGNGVSTGWRTLDRMILSGVESVDLPSQIYISYHTPVARRALLQARPGRTRVHLPLTSGDVH